MIETSAKELEAATAFLSRMLPLMTSGMTFEEAGAAILARDKKLMHVAIADNEAGKVIRSHLSDRVFHEANKRAYEKQQVVNAREAVIKENLTTERRKLEQV